MSRLTQFLSGGSSLGDTMYRHGEGALIIKEDGTHYVRSGSLIPYNTDYDASRSVIPGLFQKATTTISLQHTSVFNTHFFYANSKYFAISQGAAARMNVSSNLLTGYTSISNAAVSVYDYVKVGSNIVVSGSSLNGVSTSVKLGYINTTNNTFLTATALASTVPDGLLASNGTAAVFRGVSNVGGVIYSGDANSYYSTNGSTWNISPSSSTLPNPMCWFWSPAASKYIMAGRSETTLYDTATSSNVLDSNGATIPFHYLTMYYSSMGYDGWNLTSNKPGTTGSVSTVAHQANALYRYENNVTTSNALRYPTTAISSTPWQSLYANSPTASICSPGLYQAIVRTTDGVDFTIIDLSALLNDPVKTTQRILLSWDGTNFLAFYAGIVLYSADGITWARSPHTLYTPNPAWSGAFTNTITSVSNANNRTIVSYYTASSLYVSVAQTHSAEVTDMFLPNTAPTYAGTLSTNYIYGGTNSFNTLAYSYTRIK